MRVNVKTLDKFEGAYRVSAVSGLITGLSAGDPVFSVRWAPVLPTANARFLTTLVLERLRVKWRTISGFTAAQEVGFDVFQARAFTASDSTGTAVVLTGNNQKKRTSAPTSSVTDMRIAATGALTAGTRTLDAQPIATDDFAELAAAATVPKGRTELEVLDQDQDRYPVVLAAKEGLVVTNRVAFGAGGTGRLIVEMDWLELQRY